MFSNFYYSPFTNDKDEMLNIYEINFSDLEQLKSKEIEEGFLTEYKIKYNSEVKNKIPKIITSFANEHGGWLFIGIDEDTKDIHLMPKSSYEIQINQILKSNTSPFPQCYIRFLHQEDNNQEGIVVVWIPEGQNPPYIAKGKIYRRGGSGSDPIREIEDRYYIDKLYQKSKDNQNKIKEFCNKEISIENRYWGGILVKNYIYSGMLNLYFIPAFGDNLLKKYNGKEIAEYIIEESKKTKTYSMNKVSISSSAPFKKYSFSPESIIFRNAKELEGYDKTLGLELFFDLSAKFHYPIHYINDKESLIQEILPLLTDIQDEEILNDNFNYVRGFDFISTIFTCIGFYTHILEHFNEQNQEVMILAEVNNVLNDVLYFDIPIYHSFLQKNGLIFSDKSNYFIPFNYQNYKLKVGDITDIFSHIIPICNAFGLYSEDAIKFFIEALFKKMKTNSE